MKNKQRKKQTPADKLLQAAGDYLESVGGKALVAGGIGIIPLDDFKFHLTIKIVGKMPENKTKGKRDE